MEIFLDVLLHSSEIQIKPEKELNLSQESNAVTYDKMVLSVDLNASIEMPGINNLLDLFLFEDTFH